MSPPRLFVSDLDGTLAGHRARLSPFTRRHLIALLDAGLPFTVASARSVHTLAPILAGLPLRLPIVEFNGAFITDLKTRQPLACHALGGDVAEVVLGWAVAIGVPPFVSTYVHAEQRLYPPIALVNAGIAWYDQNRRNAKDTRLRAAVDPRSLLDQSVICLTLIAKHSVLAPLAAAIAWSFPGQTQTLLYENPYQPGWHWLTVQSSLASKAHALEAIAERAGVALRDTTVFGDEVNDISMFERAGRGVAVENAIPELKRIAHETIGPHHEDSVVRYLLGAF